MAVAIPQMGYMLKLRLQLNMVGLYVAAVLLGGGSSGGARQPCLHKLVDAEEQIAAGGCAPLKGTNMPRCRDILLLWMCKKYG